MTGQQVGFHSASSSTRGSIDSRYSRSMSPDPETSKRVQHLGGAPLVGDSYGDHTVSLTAAHDMPKPTYDVDDVLQKSVANRVAFNKNVAARTSSRKNNVQRGPEAFEAFKKSTDPTTFRNVSYAVGGPDGSRHASPDILA